MENKFANSLDADKSVLLLVDFQRRMYHGVESGDRTLLKNNVIALAKGAKILGVPTILSSIGSESNGAFLPEITELFPGQKVIERDDLTFDSFTNREVEAAIKKTGRKQLVMSGLWTSICFANTALHGLRSGYDVFGVMDTAGSESKDAHDIAVHRMIQAGIVPTTWQQVVFEWMKDWNNPKAQQLIKEVYSMHNGFLGLS